MKYTALTSILALSLLAASCGPEETEQANNTTPVVLNNSTANNTAANNTAANNTAVNNTAANNTSPDPQEDMGASSDDMGDVEADMGTPDEDMGVDMGPVAEVDRSNFDGGGRPTRVFVPDDYDNVREIPLVILLHGYSASGSAQDLYFQLSNEVDRMDFILLTPDGLADPQNNRYWNATPACCDFAKTGVDDVAYVTGLIDEAIERYNIDEGRVYLMGHSNGGFMSYTTACRAAPRITALMALAGTTFAEATDCEPEEPVGILHLHGTADETILYGGGAILGNAYPGAEETVERWSSYNGCDADWVQGESRTLLSTGNGETEVFDYPGCPENGGVSLWKINGGSHIPGLQRGWIRGPLEQLLAYDRTP